MRAATRTECGQSSARRRTVRTIRVDDRRDILGKAKNIVKWHDVRPYEGSASRTSTSLLQRAQADQSDAWQTLVQTYSRRVYRWCRRAGLQPADSANVVQDVLRAVARKLPEFRREKAGDTFRGWLRRITQNKLRDFHRSQSRLPDRAVGGTDAHQRILQVQTPPEHTATHTHALGLAVESILRTVRMGSAARRSCACGILGSGLAFFLARGGGRSIGR